MKEELKDKVLCKLIFQDGIEHNAKARLNYKDGQFKLEVHGRNSTMVLMLIDMYCTLEEKFNLNEKQFKILMEMYKEAKNEK